MKTKEFKTTILDRLNKVYNKKTTLVECLNAHISGGSISVYDPQNNRISLTLSSPVFSGLECAVSFEQLYKIFGKLKDMDFSFVQTAEFWRLKRPKGNLRLKGTKPIRA